jgi:uncharacterized membrane protein required for colicin V production
MYSVTLTGLIIIVVVVLAAFGGWATSGTTRLGREVGFVLGLLVGLVLALALLPHLDGRAVMLVVLIGVPIGTALGGAALLGEVGFAIARGLHSLRLGPLDRLLGAALSGLGALVVCAVVLHVLALAAPGNSLTREARHDTVARWLIHNPVVMWL